MLSMTRSPVLRRKEGRRLSAFNGSRRRSVGAPHAKRCGVSLLPFQLTKQYPWFKLPSARYRMETLLLSAEQVGATIVRPLLAGLFLVLSTSPTAAWEVDVHYGLTKWLALKAGFTEKEAELIASADHDIDNSLITGPVIGTILASCAGSDGPASNNVHRHHFPSRKNPPAMPAARSVESGHVWTDGGQARTPPPLTDDQSNHGVLGEYLHAFQDSWSHQGEPDVPYFCPDKQRGWGHAIKRGGWSCHLADLTYRWATDDVPAMAEATYAVLVKSRNGKSKTPWSQLAKAVDAFAMARSKNEKAEWFRTQRFSDSSFLWGTSLPDCRPGATSCKPYEPHVSVMVDRWEKLTKAISQQKSDIPAAARALFSTFFNALVDKKISEISTKIIDEGLAQAALARALHVNGQCPELYSLLISSAIGREFGDGTGGRQPIAVCELATSISSEVSGISCDDAVAAARNSLKERSSSAVSLDFMVNKLNLSKYVYSAERGQEEGEYRAIAWFPHLPLTTLLVTAKMGKDQFKITGFIWQPDELEAHSLGPGLEAVTWLKLGMLSD